MKYSVDEKEEEEVVMLTFMFLVEIVFLRLGVSRYGMAVIVD